VHNMSRTFHAVPFVSSQRGLQVARQAGRGRCNRRGTAVSTTAALPPANEIAGFFIGGGLVALVVAASKLDEVIARAQVKGFEEDRDQTWKVQRPSKGLGTIFVVPEDGANPKP